MQSKAISQLKDLALAESRRRHPNFPEYARVITPYNDKTSNGLTMCIIDFLKFSRHQAERISVTGRYVDTSRVVTDVLGHKKRIGSGKWIKGSMQRGTADISAIIRGRAIKIEVKMNDAQSQAQKEYQNQVQNAGGVYIICRSFEDFLNFYNSFK